MTYGTDKDGNTVLTLTPNETAAFEAGKKVSDCKGDRNGMVKISIQKTIPKKRSERFPEWAYGPNYKPAKDTIPARIGVNCIITT